MDNKDIIKTYAAYELLKDDTKNKNQMISNDYSDLTFKKIFTKILLYVVGFIIIYSLLMYYFE